MLPHILRSARERAGLSQADVAAAMDTSQPTVSRMESGQQVPDVVQFEKLAQLFGWNDVDRLVALRAVSIAA